MNNNYKLSNVAQKYLEDFYIILDKMEKGMIDVKLTKWNVFLNAYSNSFIAYTYYRNQGYVFVTID